MKTIKTRNLASMEINPGSYSHKNDSIFGPTGAFFVLE